MFFLNMTLLFGMLGVGIPILIHILNRRSAKAVDWGAMLFLVQSLVTRQRRVLVEEVLLLVTRCLLLGLIALAMARPFVPEGSPVPWLAVLPLALLGVAVLGASAALWRHPAWRRRCTLAGAALLLAAGLCVALERRLNLNRFGGGQRDVALIIDGSTSMTMALDGRANFERAAAEAEKLIRSGNRKSAFSIVVAGSAAQALVPAPLSDRRELLAALDGARPLLGTMHAPDALLAGVLTLAQGYNPTKQIVLITDGQRAGWEADNPARWELLGRAFAHLPVPPRIVVRTLELPTQYRNLALDHVQLSRQVVGTDREVAVTVRIANTGTEAVTPSAVELRIGGERLENRAIAQMAPGASETVTFAHRFARPGSCILEARVVVEDDLPDDNATVRAVNVVEELQVLIVDGNPAGRFLDRAGAFSVLALAPSPETAPETKSSAPPARQGRLLVAPVVVPATGLANLQRFEDYHVIVLADVPRLPAAAAERLAGYVVGGGGLLVAPGARAMPDFYDGWSVAGHGPLLPARLAEWIEMPEAGEQLRFAPTTFRHAALETAAAARDDIAACRVSACWRLVPHELAGVVDVGGRLSNGEPLLAQRRLGAGLVLLTALSLDTRGSNFAALQSFVPFMHEAIYHLANPAAPHLNLEAGRDIALRLPAGQGTPPRGVSGAQPRTGTVFDCTAIDPDGTTRRATLEQGRDDFAARIAGAVVPGLYRLFVPEEQAKRLAWLTLEDGSIPVTVGREVGESDMQALSETDFATVSRQGEFVRANSLADVESVLAGRAFGDELWRPLASGALALVAIEILLTRWITLKRRTGREQIVDFEAQTAPSATFREQLAALRSNRGT